MVYYEKTPLFKGPKMTFKINFVKSVIYRPGKDE